jgi:exosortase
MAIALVNMRVLQLVLEFSLQHEFASIVLITPFLSLALILCNRRKIFARVSTSKVPGGGVMLAGSGLLLWPHLKAAAPSGTNVLAVEAFAFVTLLIGAFVVAYGLESFRSALFPVLLLYFMVPIPEALLQAAILFLQKGSVEAAGILFKLAGTPFYRDGSTFVLPRVSIEIASQCSGIRSSIAVLISSLLVGHLLLKSAWRKGVLVLVAVPVMMFKNAVRIVVLSLLAIHVDTRWLTGSDLHQKGGILFFVVALFMLWPVLWVLRRSERTNLEGSKGSKIL